MILQLITHPITLLRVDKTIMDTNRDSAHQSQNEENFVSFSLGLEFLNEAEKGKNNGKGDSRSYRLGQLFRSYVLSKLPACSRTRQCTLKHEPIVNYSSVLRFVQFSIESEQLQYKSTRRTKPFLCRPQRHSRKASRRHLLTTAHTYAILLLARDLTKKSCKQPQVELDPDQREHHRSQRKCKQRLAKRTPKVKLRQLSIPGNDKKRKKETLKNLGTTDSRWRLVETLYFVIATRVDNATNF